MGLKEPKNKPIFIYAGRGTIYDCRNKRPHERIKKYFWERHCLQNGAAIPAFRCKLGFMVVLSCRTFSPIPELCIAIITGQASLYASIRAKLNRQHFIEPVSNNTPPPLPMYLHPFIPFPYTFIPLYPYTPIP